ncbi:aminotransferase class I/II-fold pyridoxal phosphate-dependent enzyme [Methanolapillus ohkumae]|uniref:Aminotransferase n=1 Tax=Methanolapillus ohkumae TaxID=3028298 RepID=A0AA96V8U0_9EURY|nr:Histidinol-phosphate aminotransferase [Methanosarcinaceae archaeon Am2]
MTQKASNPLKENIQNLKGCLHGGLIKESSEKYNIPERDILDFSANLNPYGTPFERQAGLSDYAQLAAEALQESVNYPDNRYLEFRCAAASFLNQKNVAADNIIPGNGSTEIIRLFCQCVLNDGDKVIIPYPTFGEYEIQCRLQNAEIIYVPTESVYTLTEEQLREAKIIFICNPNNPTAVLRKREDLLRLAEKCARAQTVLFMDEAFIELSDPDQSLADIAAENNFVFVMRSLTKCFALPGIRLGFGVASKNVADALNRARLSWNLSPLQEKTGAAFLSMKGGVHSEYLTKSRKMILTEANYLKEELSKVWGFEPGVATTNFLLIDIRKRTLTSSEMVERFARHGILIRDCISFKGLGTDFIRIAVRTREENIRFIQTVSKVFDEWAKEFAENELQNTLKTHKTGERTGGRKNERETCEYYPCHFEGQDCTFCYCPFYPCKDERTGGTYVHSSKRNAKIWSCTDCYIPHITSVVEKLLDGLMEDEETDKLLQKEWQEIILPILEEKDDDSVLSYCRKIKDGKI